MKRLSALMVVLVVVEALVLLVILVVPAHAEGNSPSCDIQVEQDFNHVVFTVAWAGGSSDGTYPFLFGDNAEPDVLVGSEGSKILPHDYAWDVGGTITYTAEVTIEGCQCEEVVVIDDSPAVPPSFMVFLPLSRGESAPPVVETSRQPSEVANHVVVRLVWSGADEVWHKLEWGDGSSIDLLGASGNRKVDHWYAEGAWEIRFAVTGPGGTTVRSLLVTIKP